MNSYSKEQKLLIVFFFTGIFFFLLSSFGVFDGISARVSSLLYNWLGYTNKWSKSYGPSWFVNMNGNISSFGSKELVFIISSIFFFYLLVSDRKKDAVKFAFTVIISLMFIVLVKYINSERETVTLKEIYTETLANFPSGHTFISTVLYPSIAYFLSIKSNSVKLKSFYITSAISIVIIVGISRVTGGGHTVTEVIAGWSLGLSWFALIKFILFRNSNTE
ncbi:Membrane-associated phospholipid phosphatase [Ignavibacterium album JCM 16511]|uniref:Membrane-associated phospholipid phosphatase n=1 Tax=Ignavibacterium album (strain DSM 19864 / JCM 16511 / NBRC 101810 / Mat9-16) TaxID=945713 RepID=I0ALL3_IGNAJ|nr:phosphatase PAP2 family protein [Ignavibacterium album]AFH49870.1 Membrane-associated phospholipid phosphatase [Ignavibacterium album JCM 16511]